MVGYVPFLFPCVTQAFRVGSADFAGPVIQAEAECGDGWVLANRLRMPGQNLFPLVLFEARPGGRFSGSTCVLEVRGEAGSDKRQI